MTSTITPSTAPAAAKKGGKRKLVTAGLLVAGALVSFAIGKSAGGSTAQAAAPAPAPITKTVTVTAPPVTLPAPPPETVIAPAPAPVTVTEAPPAPVVTGPAEEIKKSGTFVVGTDIKAGKWKSDGKINPNKYVGYFAILVDPAAGTSNVENVVTNDNPEGQAFATLEDGQGFNTENLHWTLIG